MSQEIIGQKITCIRTMTETELDEEGWRGEVLVIELENGCKIYPSRDSEGNGGGVFFGVNTNNIPMYIEKSED